MTESPFLVILKSPDELSFDEQEFFRLTGFSVKGSSLYAGIRDILKKGEADLVLLGYRFPEGNGLSLLKEIRQSYDIPVIIHTGGLTKEERIACFEAGCDDLVGEECSLRELSLRLKRHYKRTKGRQGEELRQWSLSDEVLKAEMKSHTLYLNGQVISLTASEWRIFLYLTENRGAVVSRSQILDRCFEYSFEGYDRTVDTHIKNIRQKLKPLEWIETVRGYGYRFAGKYE